MIEKYTRVANFDRQKELNKWLASYAKLIYIDSMHVTNRNGKLIYTLLFSLNINNFETGINLQQFIDDMIQYK